MQKTLYIFSFLLLSLTAYAQDDEAGQFPKAREKINAARAAYITQRLNLTAAEAEKFWPVYNEYTKKRRALKQQYREARLTEEDKKALIDLDFNIKQQELDLEKEYADQLIKIISAQQLVALRQAEIDFKKLILNQIKNSRQRRLRD